MSQPDNDARLPKQIGPYRVVGEIGAGGMGVVYEAVHETIARRVALKVLFPNLVRRRDVAQRFFNEARAVNLIEHPSLVQITDFGQDADGSAYLVMEYLKGETLASRLGRNEGRLPLVEALRIAWQIADALAAAHAKEIIHRDLKPANIMLVPEPVAPGGERVKILDFGIAKLAAGDGHQTGSGEVLGTPRYMSPEQCRGASRVDERSDVYSLGVILFQMLAGQTPFSGPDSMAIMAKHMFEPPPPLGSLSTESSPELVQVVEQLLAKEPDGRPVMSEACKLFRRLLGEPEVPESSISLRGTSGPVSLVASYAGASTSGAVSQLSTHTSGAVSAVSKQETLGAESAQPPPVKHKRSPVLFIAAGGLLCAVIIAALVLWQWGHRARSSDTVAAPQTPAAAQAPATSPPAAQAVRSEDQPSAKVAEPPVDAGAPIVEPRKRKSPGRKTKSSQTSEDSKAPNGKFYVE